MAGTPDRPRRVREFRQHLFLYALVNGALWVAWIVVGLVDGFGFVFPIFPTVIWGIALVIHGVVALRPREDDSARATSGSPGHGDA